MRLEENPADRIIWLRQFLVRTVGSSNLVIVDCFWMEIKCLDTLGGEVGSKGVNMRTVSLPVYLLFG